MRHDRGTAPTDRQDTSDLALVDAARLDASAFGALYERHAGAVHRYALRRLRDPELAADTTSVTFSRALASLDRFRPEDDSSFLRWLMTIARNTVVDTVRQRRDLVALDAETLATMRGSSNHDPAQALPPDDRARIERAIDDLGSPQREIVVLRLQGWKGREIADLLGLSHGAIRVAQHRAYARLRDSLEDIAPGRPNGASS
ncbi:MAG TPA: sigma-70 family RNA polymerase sigma factor [Thermomicrobiales bacterium]|nr:sigma-70 family RNA polymerase sigma factor [Thermomicrobiales bacterium]